ncbi:c-type cytochrome [Roseivivax sp. CAU 1761]
MSKFLKIFAPTGLGVAGLLGSAYILADQFVVDLPAPARGAVTLVAAANAEEAAPEAAAGNGGGMAATTEAAAAPETPEGGFGLGRAALPEEVAAWDIDIRPDGAGLPEGEGDVRTGEEVYVAQCASCHGDFGEAVGRWPQLAMGFDTLDGEDPVKTVGSYWPYLSTVWDYVHRAMPFGNAQSLSADEVYAITAYILYLNQVVEDDFVLSKATFSEVEMPNEGGFFMDDRAETELPEFSGEACMENCKDGVEITKRAQVLDVTPDTGGGGDAAASEAGSEETVQVAAAEDSAAGAAAEDSAAGAAAEDSAAGAAAEAPAGDTAGAAAEAPEAEQAAPEAETAALDPELVGQGEKVFRKCQACHQIGEGASNRVGPHLNGVIGRTVGGLDGFGYSDALAEAAGSGETWTAEHLAAFLADPRGTYPGTKMSFAGLRKDKDVEALLAYLRSASAE